MTSTPQTRAQPGPSYLGTHSHPRSHPRPYPADDATPDDQNNSSTLALSPAQRPATSAHPPSHSARRRRTYHLRPAHFSIDSGQGDGDEDVSMSTADNSSIIGASHPVLSFNGRPTGNVPAAGRPPPKGPARRRQDAQPADLLAMKGRKLSFGVKAAQQQQQAAGLGEGGDEVEVEAGAEHEEEEETTDEEEDVEWTQIDRMRCWRNDAMTQHLYGTAEFWGGKVWAATSNPNDAFWLAQVYFLTQQYSRAEKILTLPLPPSSHTSMGPRKSALVNGSNAFAGVAGIPPPFATAVPPLGNTGKAARLIDQSVACRYLAAQCMVRMDKWEEAMRSRTS